MTTIITKNSSTASSVPVAGDLTKGELAVNVTDKKLYTKDNGGSVVKLVGSLGNQEASAVAITGGTIDGTPIGGTTASTASFTTVSASGNVTLSGGTASGVLYLNGSKVATSGSALTFDGTNFANTAGNIQSGTNVRVGVGINTGQIYFNNTDVGVWRGAANSLSTGAYLNLGGYDGIVFATSAAGIGSQSEAMRLTSTGLGIGTSSPLAKLHVKGATNGNLLVRGGASAASGLTGTALSSINDAASATVSLTLEGSDFNFVENNAVVAKLDSSGNLGLGVTPSAWATYKALQVGQVGALWANPSGTDVYWSANYYFGSGSDRYIANGLASYYRQSAGVHSWGIAPSGTAGDPITFTQAMTLDASGNLEIGGTFAQGRRLNVDSLADGYTVSLLQTGAYNSGKLAGTVYAGYYDGSSITDMASIRGGKENTTSGNYGGMLAFYTRSNGGSDTERARIDSDGNLLVGTTSAQNGVISVYCNDNTRNCITTKVFANGNNAVGFYNASGTQVGSITTNSTGVLYNITSDQRLKENIVDAPEFGSVIDSIKVRSYDWKADGNHQRAGFVAQELVTVAPEAVHQPADPEQMMAVDYSKLVPMLVKEIQSLRARVAQLESN